MENHHAIHGKTHYFDWVIFNSYVTNYQRVPWSGVWSWFLEAATLLKSGSLPPSNIACPWKIAWSFGASRGVWPFGWPLLPEKDWPVAGCWACLPFSEIRCLKKPYPLVICCIAIDHGPVEIVSPINSMMIFHFAMETFTRGYQPFLAMYETYINHIWSVY